MILLILEFPSWIWVTSVFFIQSLFIFSSDQRSCLLLLCFFSIQVLHDYFKWDLTTLFFQESICICCILLPLVIQASNQLSFILVCILFTKDKELEVCPTFYTDNTLTQSSSYLYVISTWCDIFPLCFGVFRDRTNSFLVCFKIFQNCP